MARLISKFGNVEGLIANGSAGAGAAQSELFCRFPQCGPVKAPVKQERTELNPLLADLHLSALKSRKSSGKSRGGYLARVAIIKSLCVQLNQQFALTSATLPHDASQL